jgi:ParB family chromosome partitioning protein
MAEALGKSRSHIANLLRLLNLPVPVLELLRDGQISAGHARALIPSQDALKLAQQVIKGGLSVRATEALVKRELAGDPKPKPTGSTETEEKDADTKALEGDLSANLGMRVSLSHKPGQEGGQLAVQYKSLDQLDELCRLLSGA